MTALGEVVTVPAGPESASCGDAVGDAPVPREAPRCGCGRRAAFGRRYGAWCGRCIQTGRGEPGATGAASGRETLAHFERAGVEATSGGDLGRDAALRRSTP